MIAPLPLHGYRKRVPFAKVLVEKQRTVTAAGVRCMCGQVSSPLIRRVTQVDTHFIKELEFEPRVASEFDFQLDCDTVLQAIHAMDFFELKGMPLRPPPPTLL